MMSIVHLFLTSWLQPCRSQFKLDMALQSVAKPLAASDGISYPY